MTIEHIKPTDSIKKDEAKYDPDTISSDLSHSPEFNLRERLFKGPMTDVDEAVTVLPKVSSGKDGIDPRLSAAKDDATSDSFHTAVESLSDLAATSEVVLRTPVMLLLIVTTEILAILGMIYLLRWLVNYRGGLEFAEAFLQHPARETKHSINLHAASMATAFAFFRPQYTIFRIIFEKFSEKTRVNLELFLRISSLVAFALGMQQVTTIDSRNLPPTLSGPDKGIHLIFSIIAITVYLLHTLNFMLRTINFYYGEVKKVIVIGYLISVFLNFQLVETLGHLVDMLAFFALLTGYLSYIIILFTASDYDLRHVFNLPVNEEVANKVSEEDAYFFVIAFLAFMYLTSASIVYYKHDLEHHHGIITYLMYRHNFKEIAEALQAGKDKTQEIKHMQDIECLCQYETPNAKRMTGKVSHLNKREVKTTPPLLPLVVKGRQTKSKLPVI